MNLVSESLDSFIRGQRFDAYVTPNVWPDDYVEPPLEVQRVIGQRTSDKSALLDWLEDVAARESVKETLWQWAVKAAKTIDWKRARPKHPMSDDERIALLQKLTGMDQKESDFRDWRRKEKKKDPPRPPPKVWAEEAWESIFRIQNLTEMLEKLRTDPVDLRFR